MKRRLRKMDPAYQEATTNRLRALGDTQHDGTADEVEARLRSMTYGHTASEIVKGRTA